MVIKNLVETHCHILPGIDDGSPDIETSLKMIERLSIQGAKSIILTPHYYSDSISLNDFADRRDKAYNNLIKALPPGSPKLIPAAEVYISHYLFSNIDLSRLKIGNTDYVLLEHRFGSTFDKKDYERLVNMMYDSNIKPILAHIERYKPLISNEKILDDYIDMGCLVQVNISTFVDAPNRIKRRLTKYLESGRIHLLGSDCHNLTSRSPDWSGARTIVEKSGQEALNALIHNANVLTK